MSVGPGTTCPDKAVLIETEIDRVLTQYRESPNLLFVLRTYLGQVAEIVLTLCSVPSYFWLEYATDDQLTLLGQRLGWPRCHCVCTTQSIFGFDCGTPSAHTLSGFCDDNDWQDCGPFGQSEICLNEDELYRKFLKVRRYQMLSFYDYASLTEAIQIFWGPTAMILDAGHGRVVIAPGRPLTEAEQAVLQLYPRVLPVAPGIQVRFHFGDTERIFGFGTGWAGFCEELFPGGAPILTNANEDYLVTQTSTPIITGPLFMQGGFGEWMCEIDVHPYDCA
jgi:hypothetical protein